MDGLEEFEKNLAAQKAAEAATQAKASERERKPRHRHHRSCHHHRSRDDEDGQDGHPHKRSRRSDYDEDEDCERSHRRSRRAEDSDGHDRERSHRKSKIADPKLDLPIPDEERTPSGAEESLGLKRDSWMTAPSALDIDYLHKPVQTKTEEKTSAKRPDYDLKIHKNELNHRLQGLADGKSLKDIGDGEDRQEVEYTFGDEGAQWRMTKLKAVYKQAENSGKSVEYVALARFGDLRYFDDAREEEEELKRRKLYGEGYIGKENPSGELFQERKMEMGIRRERGTQEPSTQDLPQGEVMAEPPPPATTVLLSMSTLNRMKAQIMKAKLKGSKDVTKLESDYDTAMATFANQKPPDVVVLSQMDSRLLAGTRGEVKAVENKRGRERGTVVDNEDMTIEDMVREERRTRGQAGGESKRYAERIAKDGKYDNDEDYLNDNAEKLAKRVQHSEINLRNTAVNDFQKMNRILDNCPLCHHEDRNQPPVAPLVSLATRVFLTLPTDPEIGDGGACIIPIQHRTNLLECDDDEWEEIRNFMKCLTRMYHDQGRDVIFYENAAAPQRKLHAAMQAVPLPYSLGETAPAFFKEAILSADEEWTQHKKLIDTLARAKDGMGKSAFRRCLAKEMPYFHVWFELDGGLGHIVEDSGRWPRGDLFAREIIGGILDLDVDVIKKQGRWSRGGSGARVEGFRKRWRKFDWTRVLTEGQ